MLLLLLLPNSLNENSISMKEVNPKETSRAYAFEMWMNAPMPMVTFFKTLNVSRLIKISRKTGMKFNMLMCYRQVSKWCERILYAPRGRQADAI